MGKLADFLARMEAPPRLIEIVDTADWGEDTIGLFNSLTIFDLDHEVGHMLMAVAAALLAKAAIEHGRDIFDLTDEFSELVEAFDLGLRLKLPADGGTQAG